MRFSPLSFLCASFLGLLLPASSSRGNDVFYWTSASGQWVINEANPTSVPIVWASEPGGTIDSRWVNGASAVIEASNPAITLAPNDRSISVDRLTIAGSMTLVGGSVNTRFLTITGGGSGNLIFAMTSSDTAANGSRLIFAGTSAWNGTITLSADAGVAAKNRVLISAETAVDKATFLEINGTRLELSTPTTANSTLTVGQLKGTGGTLLFTTGTGFTKTLTLDQASDTVFAGTIEKSGAGTSALIKEGTGRLTLAGTDLIDKVSVNEGALWVDGTLTGAVTIGAGGALGGSGRVEGSVIFNDQGILHFRLGEVGNLSFADLKKGTDGHYLFDFEETGIMDELYVLSTALGQGFSAFDFQAINLADGVQGSFQIVGSELRFTTMAIPEGGTMGMMFLGSICAGSGWWRRRGRAH